MPVVVQADRRAVLLLCGERTPMDPSVIDWLVARTSGWAGARLALLVQQAALAALGRDPHAGIVMAPDFQAVLPAGRRTTQDGATRAAARAKAHLS